MKNKKFFKKIDVLLLMLFPVASAILCIVLKTNFLTTTLLFFGLPSAWLSLRTPHRVAKTALFSFVWGIPLTFFGDYMGTISGAWYVPYSVFPFRLFGVIPIEDFIWMFLAAYSILIFYEHFFDKGKQELLDKKMKYLLGPWILLVVIFIAVMVVKPELLKIPYAYFYLCLIFIFLPAITFLSFFPRLLSKYVKTASYFFVLALLFELIGLHLNNWTFAHDGYFIGWVELLGYRFPFEEFFYWFVIGAVSVLSYYEFFDDDRR